MKKISLILLSVALVFSLAFTACEDFTIVPPVEPVAYDFDSGPYEYDLSVLNKAACTPDPYAKDSAFGDLPTTVSYNKTAERLEVVMTEFSNVGGNWRASLCIPLPEELVEGLKAADAAGKTVTVTINGNSAAPTFRICLGLPGTGASWNKTGWITMGSAYTVSATELPAITADGIWFIFQINLGSPTAANKPLSAYFAITGITFDAS
jgi:hypothetical protein